MATHQTPRSILKRSGSPNAHLPSIAIADSTARRCSNSVRFPPSPTLTRTFSAHSPSSYDRSPIVVLPNTCALPARGCPGRTYHPGAQAPSQKIPARNASPLRHANHSHPAALPALVPDLSSESDESDSVASPPPPPPTLFTAPAIYAPPEPLPALSLAFLPHPYRAPSVEEDDPRTHHSYEDENAKEKEKQRRRRDRDQQQQHKGPRTGARRKERSIPRSLGEEGGELEEDGDDAEDDDISGCSTRYKTFGERSALSGCGFDDGDDGCLGGF